MHKWEEKQRQKIHDSKIQNAKSQLQRISKSRERPLCSSRSKINPVPNQPPIPFMRILEIFELKKYASLLQLNGFPQRLVSKKTSLDIEEMITKVDLKDKDNFYSMMGTLQALFKKVLKEKKGSSDSKMNSILSRSDKSHFPPSSSKISTLHKGEKTIDKNKEKLNHENFRIKIKSHPLNNSLERKVTKDKRQHAIKPFSKERKVVGESMDDMKITHNYRKNSKGVPTLITNSNSIIRRLSDKLKKKEDIVGQMEGMDINFDLKKIQQMYLSYDSATLTSNIINIDVEQIIDCLTLHILQIVSKHQVIKRSPPMSSQKIHLIEQLLRQSYIEVKQESKDSQTQKQNQQEIQDNLPQRNKNPQKSDSDAVSVNKQSDEEVDSDDWQYDVDFYSSVVKDFSCFDNKFKDSILMGKVTHEDIKNFIQLVMMAGKMQKEVPIIANVYISRLLKKAKNSQITNSNWRNILLVTFIEASKIWDDQSLENHSFAKVIKPYTTLQINRLEKYLLAYLNYELTVGQKEYSQSYFNLRKHATNATKTCNLLKLDIRTIKKLQSGSKKNQAKLKDFYEKSINKSF